MGHNKDKNFERYQNTKFPGKSGDIRVNLKIFIRV